MMKFTSSVFVSSNNFFVIFFTYKKLFKYSSGKYYQNKKERLTKKSCKRYQSFSKEEKEKSHNMVENNTKIYQKMKNKSLLSIEKML